jgi:hypothetical protein
MCQRQLRLLADSATGLCNNKFGKKLRHRLEMVYQHRFRLEKLRANKAKWFCRDRRPAMPQDLRGSLRYATAEEQEEFNFDEKLVLERFAGKGSWQTWQAEGTINVPSVLSRPAQSQRHDRNGVRHLPWQLDRTSSGG